MKSFLPWLCVVGLLGGVIFLFSANQKLTREMSALRDETNQTQTVRAELEQLKTTGSPAQAQQIAQLQKDNQELLKLRNEVRQLRDEKKQLSQQAQTAQAQAQAAQANVLTLSTNLQAVEEARRQKMMAERYGLVPGAQQPQPILACINLLRQLDGAKQQWALENRKTANDTPAEKDIAVYLKGGMPRCPAGGAYVLNAVGVVPTCSIPGHALPQAQ
jgi:predicted ribosome quality control (RQC) complex YloA/Tae2 family protein